MITEAPAASVSPSLEERMARIEGQQKIIIELLRGNEAKFEAMNQRLDAPDAKIDAVNHRCLLGWHRCSS